MKRVLTAILLLSGCQWVPPDTAGSAAPAASPAHAAEHPAPSAEFQAVAPDVAAAMPPSAPDCSSGGDCGSPPRDAQEEAPAVASEVEAAPADALPAPASSDARGAALVDVPSSAPSGEPEASRPQPAQAVEALCGEVGGKLGSVSVEDCLAQPLQASGRVSVNGRPLVLRDFQAPAGPPPQARILVLGGLHGDEYSSISIMFKWMVLLAGDPPAEFSWRFLPVANPDGLLDGQAVRQNANGVDLNRNFPSRDWPSLALREWERKTGGNPRRFPGTAPASEPETQWVVEQIRAFQPDVIVSVHAPYHLLDYDGPARAPEKIGELYLHQLGVFPGSLGNYAGLDLGLPVVTLELPSAGIMPSPAQITTMWNDLLRWLRKRQEEGAS